MNWLSAAFWAWFGWNVLAPLAMIVLILLIFVLPRALKDWWVQSHCKHVSYYETRACDAICSACGLNLGFIGTVREQRKTQTAQAPKQVTPGDGT